MSHYRKPHFVVCPLRMAKAKTRMIQEHMVKVARQTTFVLRILSEHTTILFCRAPTAHDEIEALAAHRPHVMLTAELRREPGLKCMTKTCCSPCARLQRTKNIF